MVGGRLLLVRMHGIAVDGEARQRKAVILEDALDAILLLLRSQHFGGVEEGLPGIGADGQFDGVEADLGAVRGNIFEFTAGKECGHHA